jgi:PadR family transcriptional regulator, regulatory protein AphA
LQELNLTPLSYIVLGLLELGGEATPYGLKQFAGRSVGHFWTLQHAQLYTEPARLADAGYLEVEREESGRRRKRYSITEKGRAALAEWRETPPDGIAELRDPGLLKLFFGADPVAVAEAQLKAHREKLAVYEEIRAGDTGRGPRGPWLALESGIRHEREMISFWEELAGE